MFCQTEPQCKCFITSDHQTRWILPESQWFLALDPTEDATSHPHFWSHPETRALIKAFSASTPTKCIKTCTAFNKNSTDPNFQVSLKTMDRWAFWKEWTHKIRKFSSWWAKVLSTVKIMEIKSLNSGSILKGRRWNTAQFVLPSSLLKDSQYLKL